MPQHHHHQGHFQQGYPRPTGGTGSDDNPNANNANAQPKPFSSDGGGGGSSSSILIFFACVAVVIGFFFTAVGNGGSRLPSVGSGTPRCGRVNVVRARKLPAAVRDAASAFTNGLRNYGSQRVTERPLLLNTSPEAARKFATDIAAVLDGFDAERCIYYLSQGDRSDTVRLAHIVNPGAADDDCACRIIVDDDISKASEDIRGPVLKSLFEVGWIPTSRKLVERDMQFDVDKTSRVMYIAAVPPGASVAQLLEPRLKMMMKQVNL